MVELLLPYIESNKIYTIHKIINSYNPMFFSARCSSRGVPPLSMRSLTREALIDVHVYKIRVRVKKLNTH